MKPARWHELLVLNTYWLGLSFMWNGLHVIILPAVLLNYVPAELKNTALGMLTFTGLIIAMLVQPLSGVLSDRWVSRWGRRRPLILLGTLGDFIFLAILGWAGGLPWLALGYIGLQFSSNMAHGPMQGLMPDQLPPGAARRRLGIQKPDRYARHGGLVALPGAAVRPCRRPPQPAAGGDHRGIGRGGSSHADRRAREGCPAYPSAQPMRRQNRLSGPAPLAALFHHGALSPYARLIIARFAFLLGVYGIQTFAQYYVQDVLKAADPPKLTGDLLAAIAVSLIIFALLGGWLGDRFGHIRMHYVAGGIATLGSLLMLFARTPLTLLIFGSVFGIGIGLFLTANWALASLLAPPGDAGKYLGLTNIATAGSAAVGRLLGPLIDLANNARPGEYLGYTGLFLFSAVCALGSIFLIRRVNHTSP